MIKAIPINSPQFLYMAAAANINLFTPTLNNKRPAAPKNKGRKNVRAFIIS